MASVKVLLIDDDESLASMLSQYLSGHELDVVWAESGEAGLEKLRDQPFDVVILDVMLPGEDGFTLLPRLRSASDVPVLMLTARGDDTDRIVGLELGADDYLSKPFNPREIVARLRALVRRQRRSVGPGTGEAKVLRFGRLEVDCTRRVVRLDGEERGLTGVQFDLLVALAENADRVMTRGELLRRARGRGFEPFDRSIDVHVSRIRAAVEDDPQAPRRILTIRGVGYVFASGAFSRRGAQMREAASRAPKRRGQ
jgi:DNA-binding response OmpR family regulator